MCDLMLSSTHANKVTFHVCIVRIVHLWKTKVTVFFNIKIPSQNGHNDILKILI